MLRLTGIAIAIGGRPLISLASLEAAPGEVVTIMGPSGSGKSSLLDFIGGNLSDDLQGSGRIELNGRELSALPPEKRRIGRLFQDDLLFPHLTVGENLLFGIPRGLAQERSALMRQALEQAELPGFEDRPPHHLSNGERVRVALMRALLAKPDAMLLDEPFSRLDAELRLSIRRFVFGHVIERNIPALLVSHDLADTPLGARIFRVGRDGVLES